MLYGAGVATLSSAQRRRLPSNVYALPAQRKYPIPDKAHARNAKARASEAYHQGRISKAEYDRINARADLMLDGGHHPDHGHVFLVDSSGKGAARTRVKPDNQPTYKMRANVPRRANAAKKQQPKPAG